MDCSISSDNDSFDVYQPNGSEHYTSSDEEEPYVSERNLDVDDNDSADEGPRPKKVKKKHLQHFKGNSMKNLSQKYFSSIARCLVLRIILCSMKLLLN